MTLSAAARTLLEKVAVDNGFDVEVPAVGNWLGYASTQAPLKIWLTAEVDGQLVAAFSQWNVARALAAYGEPLTVQLPPGAVTTRTVTVMPALYRMLRRAFQLSKALPDELLRIFQKKTAGLPRTTETERLVVQRVGQDVFRAGLVDYWEGCCAVTGLAVPMLLRASHIKPWADCETDAERLDVFNGLLLGPNLDAAFDCGLITFGDDGSVCASSTLPPEACKSLGIEPSLRAELADGHRAYLNWHRERVFKK